jgi:tetrahydromethanopterin S-methyltransferase subunit A
MENEVNLPRYGFKQVTDSVEEKLLSAVSERTTEEDEKNGTVPSLENLQKEDLERFAKEIFGIRQDDGRDNNG